MANSILEHYALQLSGEERKKYTIAVLIVKRIKTIQNNKTSGLATARLQCKKGSSALNEP